MARSREVAVVGAELAVKFCINVAVLRFDDKLNWAKALRQAAHEAAKDLKEVASDVIPVLIDVVVDANSRQQTANLNSTNISQSATPQQHQNALKPTAFEQQEQAIQIFRDENGLQRINIPLHGGQPSTSSYTPVPFRRLKLED